MREIVFHRLASQELRAAAAWYAARSEQARSRFRQAVSDAVDRIAANPQAHAAIIGRFRCVRVRRFPYLLIFDLHDDGVVMVLAVAHASRRPGYWRRRG